MAFQQNGYALVPQAVSYNEWRGYCLTHGVNVDWSYGNQCWDVCALLWYQYGLRLQTGNGKAWGCWVLKQDDNARPPFSKVTRLQDVKRGDCIVLGQAGSYATGHICFADEDYNGSIYLSCLGQNQGQGISSGTPSNIVRMSMNQFLGGFRNSNWTVTPPTPTPTKKSGRFPWVLYSRKLRNKR